MRVIALVSDAYGGRGGIALYNRNLLKALCQHPEMNEVIALPRSITYDLEDLPKKLTYIISAAGSKNRYLFSCLRTSFSVKNIDLIICGHLHLLPFAYLLKLFFRCEVVPVIYGVEAWKPTSHKLANFFCRKVKSFISIRKLTAKRFIEWANLNHAKFYYLPNCIDGSQYGVAPKSKDLLKKLGLENKNVVMTAGRMDSIEYDLRKGFDEILEILPELKKQVPDVVYLIIGDGDDKDRLAQKAKELGVEDIVRFTGYVSNSEKANYYRLADVFAMPGSSLIFDRYPFRFVFLEALACGLPVVGCELTDESEVNDSDAKTLIIQVDPSDKEGIIKGIIDGITHAGNGVSPVLENYYFPSFKDRLNDYIKLILDKDV